MGYWSTSLLLGILLAVSGCVQKAVSSPDQTNTPAATNALTAAIEADTASLTGTNTFAEDPGDLPAVDIADADFKPIATPKAVPATVRTNGPLGEVIRMSDSGVDEGVLLAFVTNSTSVFGLDADEIIYLNDIGVPTTVVTAMIQQDQLLRANAAGMTNVWQQAAPAETAQAPADVAPQATAPVADASAQAPPPPAEGAQAVPEQQQQSVTYNTFYSTLSPYGNWVNIEGYGNVWQPAVVVSNPDWSPYVHNGRWLYTDAGWYWYSDYSWGWAPFHYGRWFRHYRLGWCWYPDYVWGPSWVTWRYNDGYCGWAPLPPGAWWRPGIGLTWWGRHVGFGFTFGLGYHHYSFVSWNRFHHHGLHHYRIRHHDDWRRAYSTSVVATRIHGNRGHAINDGLPAARVAKATGSPLKPISIQASSNLSGRNIRPERLDKDRNTVSVFRPAIPRQNREPGAGGVAMRPGSTTTPTVGKTASTRPATTTATAPRSIAANRLASTRNTDSPTGTTRTWERPVPANGRATPVVRTETTRSPSTINRQGRDIPTASTSPSTPATAPTSPTTRSPFAVSPQSRQAPQRTPVTPGTAARPTQAATPAPSAQAAPSASSRAPTTGVWQRGQPQLQARTERSTTATTPNTPPPQTRTQSSIQRQAPSASTAPQSIWQRPNTTTTQPAASRAQPESANRWPGTTRSTTPAPTYTPPNRSYSTPAYQAPAPRVETQRAPTPTYQAPSRTYEAPTRSAPSYSAPAPRAPSAPSYSAPARSAPSAPPSSSRSSGGGGGRDTSGSNRQSR